MPAPCIRGQPLSLLMGGEVPVSSLQDPTVEGVPVLGRRRKFFLDRLLMGKNVIACRYRSGLCRSSYRICIHYYTRTRPVLIPHSCLSVYLSVRPRRQIEVLREASHCTEPKKAD